MCIRHIFTRDLPQLLTIEAQSFDLQRQWSAPDFLPFVNSPYSFVYEFQERIIGYVIAEMSSHKIEIRNLAVHELNRRERIGSQLLSQLVENTDPQHVISMTIPETMLEVQLFLRTNGFRYVSTEFKLYGQEDGYELQFVRPKPGKHSGLVSALTMSDS